MRVLSINLYNFMSYEKVELNFKDLQGMTLLVGPNGSGKSSIFEAISWVLFGKTIRNLSSDGVIKEGSSSCEVWIVVEVVNNIIEVKRYRSRNGKVTLIINGTDTEGTVTGKQDVLEKMLGMDYQNFINTVMFGGGNVSSFCRMTDAERKRAIEGLLGFDIYSNALSFLKKDKDMYKSQMEKYVVDRNNIENQIEMLEESITEYEASSNNYNIVWIAESLEFIKDIGELQELEQELLNKIADERIHISIVGESFRWAEEDYRVKLDEIRQRRKQCIEDIKRINREMEEIKQLKKDHVKNLKENEEINKIQEGGICPFCKQVLPRNFAFQEKTTKPLKYNIEELDVRYKKLFNSEAAKQTEIDNCDKESDKVERPDEPDYDLLNKLKMAMSNNLSHQKTFKLKERQHLAKRDNPFMQMKENALLKVEALKDKLNKLKSDMVEVDEYLFITEYWEKAFNYNGIPSYLLDNILPVILKFADEYSDILTDGELKVDFSHSEKGKLNLSVKYADGGDGYQAISTGEKTRVDLSLLFAIRDALEYSYKGSGFVQMFVDEVFNGLDEQGIEAVVNVIKNKFNKKQVFIITHDDSLKAYADNIINISKVNGSTIVN